MQAGQLLLIFCLQDNERESRVSVVRTAVPVTASLSLLMQSIPHKATLLSWRISHRVPAMARPVAYTQRHAKGCPHTITPGPDTAITKWNLRTICLSVTLCPSAPFALALTCDPHWAPRQRLTPASQRPCHRTRDCRCRCRTRPTHSARRTGSSAPSCPAARRELATHVV